MGTTQQQTWVIALQMSAYDPKRTYQRPRELAGGGPPLVVSLTISQTQDVRDDAVGIIIFDHKIWHCTVRGVQRSSKCRGCHSWSVGNPRETCHRFLDPRTPEVVAARLRGLQGLKETSYVEGENVSNRYRWAEDQIDRLPALATDLVRRPVTVIVAPGPQSSFAAKAATTTISIVFVVAPTRWSLA